MLRRMYGSKGRNVTRSQCSQAQLYTVDGRLDDPMSLHEELLAMKRHIHGSKGHSDVGVSDTAARTFRGLFPRPVRSLQVAVKLVWRKRRGWCRKTGKPEQVTSQNKLCCCSAQRNTVLRWAESLLALCGMKPPSTHSTIASMLSNVARVRDFCNMSHTSLPAPAAAAVVEVDFT